MRLAPAVFQPRAVHLHVSEQRANGDWVIALAVARFTTLRAASQLEQRLVDLFLDHALLNLLQNQLAFRQGEAEGFHLQSRPLDARSSCTSSWPEACNVTSCSRNLVPALPWLGERS